MTASRTGKSGTGSVAMGRHWLFPDNKTQYPCCLRVLTLWYLCLRSWLSVESSFGRGYSSWRCRCSHGLYILYTSLLFFSFSFFDSHSEFNSRDVKELGCELSNCWCSCVFQRNVGLIFVRKRQVTARAPQPNGFRWMVTLGLSENYWANKMNKLKLNACSYNDGVAKALPICTHTYTHTLFAHSFYSRNALKNHLHPLGRPLKPRLPLRLHWLWWAFRSTHLLRF